MGRLSKQEQTQLDELLARRDAPDDDDGDDGDPGIVVLRGDRADNFLSSLLGSGKHRRQAPDDDGDEDQGDEEGGEPPDPAPPAENRYFRQRRKPAAKGH